MELHLTRDMYGRVTIAKREGDVLSATVTERFNKQSQFNSAAKVLGIPAKEVMQHVDAFQRSSETNRTVRLGGAVDEFTVILRGKKQKASQGQHLTNDTAVLAFEDALRAHCDEPEPIIHWKGTDRLAALDIDWHGLPTLPDIQLNDIIRKVNPRPFAAWITHGRGLRLVYHATDDYTADELAAVAALSVKQQPGTALAGVEIKDVTRHPGYPRGDAMCGPVQRFSQTSDVSALAEMLGQRECDAEEVAEWLAERDMEVGRRYDHDKCPARPDDPSHNEPVLVRDDHIYCMSCAGLGVTLGHKTPGYFPFSSLIGKNIPHLFRVCLENFVHWAQARYLVADAVQMPENAAKAAYAAALKMKHGNDPRIPAVFLKGQDFVRLENRWASEKGQAFTSDVRPILATLPACQYVNADGEVKVDPERLARFDQPVDLSRYGYPALSLVWGFRIYGHRLPYRDPSKLPFVIHTPLLAPPEMEIFRPKYIKGGMSEEEAWAVLENVFPGVDRNAVKLLIAAKGAAEGDVGLPPLIYIDGPSGSSKTAIVKIAAAICGDGDHSVQWTNQIERVRQTIMETKERGSFTVFNEVIKEIKATKKSDGALEFVLNLTPDSLSHKLYVGPVPLGTLPVICFTDTKLPISILQNTQLARRMVRVHLSRRVEWEQTIKDNLGKLEYLRLTDPLFTEACNVILSRVIDTYFTKSMTFDEIAEKLGFYRLEKSDAVNEKKWALLDVFRQVAVAPDAEGYYAKRWSGRGWKIIKRSDRTELSDAWSAVSDAEWFTSEQCSETDWAGLLGVEQAVDFDIRRTASVVAIRFVSGDKVNGEISDGSVELDAEAPGGGDDRPGDAERSESQESGGNGVPERQYDPAPMLSGQT